jgi:hypothetical protein
MGNEPGGHGTAAASCTTRPVQVQIPRYWLFLFLICPDLSHFSNL